MAKPNIRFDPRQMDEVKQLLRAMPKAGPRLVARALKRTLRAARTKVVDAIWSELMLKKSDLFQRNNRRRPIQEKLNRRGGQVAGAEINITGRRIPVSKFRARQLKRGVSYRISRAGSRAKIPDAFVTKFRSGHEAVAARRGPAQRTQRVAAGERRSAEPPMIELYGPSIPHVAGRRGEIRFMIREGGHKLLTQHLGDGVEFLMRHQRPPPDA